jgi:hypothetical protein
LSEINQDLRRKQAEEKHTLTKGQESRGYRGPSEARQSCPFRFGCWVSPADEKSGALPLLFLAGPV